MEWKVHDFHPLLRKAQYIASATNRLYKPFLSTLFQLIAEMSNIYFKNIRSTLKIVAPDAIHQEPSCQDKTWVAQEEGQQFIFCCAQIYDAITPSGLAGGCVQFKVCKAQYCMADV